MASIKRALFYLLHNRIQFLDSVVKNFCGFLPDKQYLSLRYRLKMGHWIDWKNPKTFTEKLQWLKVYDYKPEYTQMVDKLAAKGYVAARIGEEYIIPTLGVWDRVEDIDWDSLPEQFVLKTTHGGGGCGVVVCSDKAKFDKAKAIKKLEISMRTNAGQTYRERPYLNVPRKIIAEKFMAERKTDGKPVDKDLPDYKFFCFNGEPKYCQVIRDRNTKETIDFYDMEWNLMPFVGLNPVAKNGISPVAKPLHLDDMIEICRKLSKNMKFSRIDLYVINDKEYFGEITLYPAAGFGEFTPEEWNLRLGDLIKLDGIKTGGVKCEIQPNEIVCTFLHEETKDLQDYKFFCFNGEPKFLYVSDSPNHELVFLNTDWTVASFGRKDYKPLKSIPPKPDNLDEMLIVARKLSKGVSHVRVDLYNVDGHVYFGELTFYTGAGFIPFDPQSADRVLGEMLKLPSGGVKFKVEIINNKCVDIENRNSFEDLKDYKFFCFGGKVKCFKIDFGRFIEHHANYYSPQGKLLPFGEKGLEPDPNHVEVMPENLYEMIRIAEKLSQGFKFLRVDLYNVKGKIYFGELTFYPAAGMGAFVPEEWDGKLGEWINLNNLTEED